ncbi:hypothetical protein [Pseudomonas phage Almagne]|nr:hypothetical protein [Pseudomonas phage Almagne]
MPDLISISEVAKEMGWSYHTTRNRLAANDKTKSLGQKVGHSVCYQRAVLEVLRGPTQ